MIYITLKKAKNNIIDKHEAEYAKIFAYENEIKRQMLGSSVKIMSEPVETRVQGMRLKRMYIFLASLKEGILDGYRQIIQLDQWHLRDPLCEILLTAVDTYTDDGMYISTQDQVEGESNSSCDRFIGLLKDDLHMKNVVNHTFICDRQKILVNALKE